jgi:hypothetical protein
MVSIVRIHLKLVLLFCKEDDIDSIDGDRISIQFFIIERYQLEMK